MKKKVLSVLLAVAMTATMIAGCGSTETAATDEAPATDAAATTEAATTEAAAEEEPWTGTLLVWGPQEDQDAGWLQAQCDAFNEAHPAWDITFEYGVCPEGDAKKNIVTDVEASADVYMFANDNIPELVAAGALAELGGSYLEQAQTQNSDSLLASVTYNDAVYGFPFTSNTWFMYYDASAFSEDEVKSLDKMLAKDKVAFEVTNSWYIEAFYCANGCTLFGDGTDEAAGIDFSGDKAVAATDYMVDLVKNPNFVSSADGAGLAGLREGTVKAFFSGSWDAEAAKEALGDNFAAAGLPTVNIGGNEGQMKAFVGSKAIGVNPNAENPQVAMSLAAYLASDEAQQAHYDARNVIPSSVNVTIEGDPVANATAAVVNYGSVMQPLVAKMSNYWSPAENMGKAILAGDVTHDNSAEKTEDMNTAMNTEAAE